MIEVDFEAVRPRLSVTLPVIVYEPAPSTLDVADDDELLIPAPLIE